MATARSVSSLVRETLEGVDFDEFFKEDEEKAPRKRVKKIVMDDDDDPIVDDVVLSKERVLREDPIEDEDSEPTWCTETFGGLQVVPNDDHDGVMIFGNISLNVLLWLERHHGAKYDADKKCWTVKLSNGLSYSSFVFRLRYCMGRMARARESRQVTVCMSRKFDEKEAAQTEANQKRYMENLKIEQAKQHGRMLYPIYCALCPCCGHDHFFEQAPEVSRSSCSGCCRAWDD